MMPEISRIISEPRRARPIVLALLGLACQSAAAQHHAPVVKAPDSVTVAVGAHYEAGGFHRWLFGGAYRDLWLTPIRVPVLNLRTYQGGLTPGKEGGGVQTKSLRFTTPDGTEYLFRSVDKDSVLLPSTMSDVGFVKRMAQDGVSNTHPASNVIMPVLLEAAGILHEATVLVALPDDPLLGKYRTVFARRVGTLSLYPGKPKDDVPGFAGAIDIIDSDSLLHLIDSDPAQRIDAPAFLNARLLDMMVGNWDRHPKQWKWARFEPAPRGAWEPISRDMDKAFISISGVVPHALSLGVAREVPFGFAYPSMRSLTVESLELDRRLLNGLAWAVWDSVAHALQGRMTNQVIDDAMHAMPKEYQPKSAADLSAKLRTRRDSIPVAARRFYQFLASVIDIHGTDAEDHATITRVDDRHVEVQLTAANGATYFDRTFDAEETSEIRVYLHGGDDRARIVGDVHGTIPVRVIGGNGANRIVDSSTVGGHHGTADLYDAHGSVTGVSYGVDTLFNRRPFVGNFQHLVPPARDRGAAIMPTAGLSINHDMGVMPRIGLTSYHYGFRKGPYASMLSLEGRYSFKIGGGLLKLTADQRRESSPIHFEEEAQVSDIEEINWHGLGNSSPQSPGLTPNVTAPRTDFFSINQRQWSVRPALARALGENTDISLGPIVEYVVTDSTPERFISESRPYGFGHFGEAGLRLFLYSMIRNPPRHPQHGTSFDLTATYYPAVWDVENAFGSVSANGAVYFTLPLPQHPFLGLKLGGKKVFGDFPFQEAAFIGGRGNVRTLDLQRYAGDASVYSTAEIRIPMFNFTLIVPVNTGLLASEDIGRVYVNGDSPGGWHNAFGAGFWVGFHDLTADIRVMRSNEVGRPAVIALRLAMPSGIW